jgi:putative transposase
LLKKAQTPSDKLRLHRFIFRLMEEWLDRSSTDGVLARPDIAAMLMEAIRFRRQNRGWQIPAYVVMPTHLHLYVKKPDGRIMRDLSLFKRWTGHQAGKLVDLEEESFWHREWFDHWVRSQAEEEKVIRYIQNNPVKAGLVKNYQDWPYGSWAEKD